MTNKVKPFYIRITDDMTPQMVQDAFDKCVDAGAVAEECIAETDRKHGYQDECDTHYNHFGVDDDNVTVLYDNHENYGIDAKEITLDQLDEWLGLESKVEWDGNGLPPVGVECEVYGALGESSAWNKCKVFAIELGVVFISNGRSWTSRPANEFKFRKPETPEQKAERERLEAAYDLYCCAQQNKTLELDSFDVFIRDMDMRAQAWLAIVDKTNYRKQ